jgi:hypothetical protein
MRPLVLLLLVLPSLALAQVQLSVETSKKTTKTGEKESGATHTATYVERITLKVSVAGEGNVDVACYFVARNAQTQALKYHGAVVRPLTLSRVAQTVRVESEPTAYSQKKARHSTAEPKVGDLAHGWVVKVLSGGRELSVKASSPEILQWVRDNPPRRPAPASS